jgi:hypothetical protein
MQIARMVAAKINEPYRNGTISAATIPAAAIKVSPTNG